MPYSITTRDGITIDGIPDDMPADSLELKDRVARIRGQGSQPASDVKAPSSGIAMGLRDPVDAGAQILRRVVGDKIGGAVDTFGNWLADKGLPVARSEGVQGVDRIVNDVNKGYEDNRKSKAGGADPGFDLPRLAGNMLNPVNYVGGGAAVGANTVRNLAVAGAKAGAISGALQPVVGEQNQQDFWTNKGEQAVSGAVSGAVLNPAINKAGEAAGNAVNNAVQRARPAPTGQQIKIAINNTFATQGVNPAEVPDAIRASVARQVEEAMRAGQRLNPSEMMRRARFEAVGLTGDAAPTAGQLSRDPMQFANEKDLSGVRIRMPNGAEGNPLADRFNLQNRRLQDVFDTAGARDATDRVTAGQTFINALGEADAPVRQRVDDLYTAARGMNEGRLADLDRAHFSQNVNSVLDQQMLGGVLPAEVRNTINEISAGQKVLGHHGPTVDVPFNVQVAQVWDSLLSKQQRKYGHDSPEGVAIGAVRRALHDTPLVPEQPAATRAAADTVEGMTRNFTDGIDDVVPRMQQRPALPAPPSRAVAVQPGAEVGGTIPPIPHAPQVSAGQAARDAFDQARRAARDRFATIEATPALRAALDEEAPDKFVQSFILNADTRDVQAMRNVLQNSPEALAQARAQIADHLKRAAFGENLSGDKTFTPERYNKTLRAIGRQKLEVFFSPAEIVRMNLAAQVASDMNSVPAGAKPNFSNSGSAVMNLLSKITEAPLARRIPGVRALSNQVGEIKTEQAINQALRPAPAQPRRELTPEQVRALQFFLAPAGVAGGVLGGSALNP